MPDFSQTVRGAKFYDHDVPKLAKGVQKIAESLGEECTGLSALIYSINRVAAAIEESNRIQCEMLSCMQAAKAPADDTDGIPF